MTFIKQRYCQEPSTHLPVSSGISKIRNHSRNFLGRRSSTSVYHDQKLHQILVSRSASGLHQVDVAPPDALFQLNVDLSVSESLDLDLAEVQAHVPSDLLRERWIRGAGE